MNTSLGITRSFGHLFNQAVAACERSRAKKGNIDGIGFIIARDQSRRRDQQIIGIDIDEVRDPVTGWTSPWACDILQRLDCPTSISISGTGYHVFAIGKLPDGLDHIEGHGADDLTEECKAHILAVKPDNKSWNGLEIYVNSPRHLTVTGQWLQESPQELQKRSRVDCRHSSVIPGETTSEHTAKNDLRSSFGYDDGFTTTGGGWTG